MLRKTVMPMPPAIKTNGWSVSFGRTKSPFGSSTSTSAPTESSASVRLKAVSRTRVQRPSTPRSFGEVTAVMCRRSPFSSWWPMSGSVTKKYWPGWKSTSRPRRSKVTSRVPVATSCFSLICACTQLELDADRREEDEYDGRHGQQSVQGDDRDGEVLLGRQTRRGSGRDARAGLPALPPDREHPEAEERDQNEDRERNPGEGVAVGDEVDDPEDKSARGQREVAEDQCGPDLPARPPLAHAAVAKPQP